MSLTITQSSETLPVEEPHTGFGALHTEHGNLPLRALDIDCRVVGVTVRTIVTQTFRNPHNEPIEATYIFPLPDRAAVTDMTMTVQDRKVTANLQERDRARKNYSKAIAEGKRAALAETDRADVFTMHVGNILPGEEAVVSLSLVGPLICEDDEVTLRFPLVVAPRFIPGIPIDGPRAGGGYADDTSDVPDASRITPPVLLPGFPNPVELSIKVDIDPAGLQLFDARSSLHAVVVDEDAASGHAQVRIEPGERVDRDFILRFRYAQQEHVSSSAVVAPDKDNPANGTFQLTVVPPVIPSSLRRDRDVVLLLDRSGSMKGWKMVAARRAAARIVDTLATTDRFAVRCFDNQVSAPEELGDGLATGSDRHRFAAVEHLAGVHARGGTQMMQPLLDAADVLNAANDQAAKREQSIILVTDGQVGNEDQILAQLRPKLGQTRIHVIGIDKAVNAGFAHRLALAGRGRCELVETQDRLDEASSHIHRRIAGCVLTDMSVSASRLQIDYDTMVPAPLPDVFPAAPVTVWGRYSGATDAADIQLSARDADGKLWTERITPDVVDEAAVTYSWARAQLRTLEDQYAAEPSRSDVDDLEKQIIDISLRHHVLSKFTAFVAVDSQVVNEGGVSRTIVQPVELPQGWEMDAPASASGGAMPASAMMAATGGAMTRVAGGTKLRMAGGRSSTSTVGKSAGRRGNAGMSVEYLHNIAETERELLSAAVNSPRERRMLLADLATRLRAVLNAIEKVSILNPQQLQRLQELVVQLAKCDSVEAPAHDALDSLWDETVAVLSMLASPAEGGDATAGEVDLA